MSAVEQTQARISFTHHTGKKESVDIEADNVGQASDWLKVVLALRG